MLLNRITVHLSSTQRYVFPENPWVIQNDCIGAGITIEPPFDAVEVEVLRDTCNNNEKINTERLLT